MAMKLQLHSVAGGGSVDVSEAAFGKEFNEALVHQVVTAYLARRRSGTKAQKTSVPGAWRRHQAVAPERHGSRARRNDTQPDLGRRRSDFRGVPAEF